METVIQESVFNSLLISREQVLDEVAILMAHQKKSEYRSEVEWFENKYQMNFDSFDAKFKEETASFELEHDWLAWKFAEEGVLYWSRLLDEASK